MSALFARILTMCLAAQVGAACVCSCAGSGGSKPVFPGAEPGRVGKIRENAACLEDVATASH